MKHVSRLGLSMLLAVLVSACFDEPLNLTSKTTGGTSTSTSGKTKITTVSGLTITCGTATQTSVEITVTAGETGAPAGFSIQWMTAEAFAANGGIWYASDDSLLCKASFSGNANLSRYNLTPGQTVTVNVGEFLFDNGASSNCIDALSCGSSYVFHAFAHATNNMYKSSLSTDLTCSTLPCGHEDSGCTLTQGYWKNHGPLASGNNENEWPVDSLTLGGVSYTQLELQAIFNKPASGNGLIAMAHQLIAAKLNAANGADTSDVQLYIDAADALIGSLVVPPVGTASLSSGVTSSLTNSLASFNEGAIGPGHCE
jgi:hypothetical protein